MKDSDDIAAGAEHQLIYDITPIWGNVVGTFPECDYYPTEQKDICDMVDLNAYKARRA